MQKNAGTRSRASRLTYLIYNQACLYSGEGEGEHEAGTAGAQRRLEEHVAHGVFLRTTVQIEKVAQYLHAVGSSRGRGKIGVELLDFGFFILNSATL